MQIEARRLFATSIKYRCAKTNDLYIISNSFYDHFIDIGPNVANKTKTRMINPVDFLRKF